MRKEPHEKQDIISQHRHRTADGDDHEECSHEECETQNSRDACLLRCHIFILPINLLSFYIFVAASNSYYFNINNANI